MSDSQDLVIGQANAQLDTLDELWQAIDHAEGCDHQDPEECETCADGAEYGDTLDERREYLQELPLEIVYEMGEPFAVVLGTGGPHVEITGGGRSGGYVLATYWGGETVRRSGEAVRRTGEFFRQYVEETGQ